MEKEAINKAIAKVVGKDGNFADSLDAMHEAEKVLTYTQRATYSETLYHVKKDACIERSYEGNHDLEGWFSLLTATAAQRSEAFLRTLNLYQPEGGDL